MSNDTAMRQRYSAAHWGIYEVDTVRESNLPRLRALSVDPDPTRIGLDQLDPQTQALRIKRPAIRKSWLEKGAGANPELRGREPFVEVDWETALAAAAVELHRVKAEHGNQSIFGGSYGWSSAGRFHHAQSQMHRFLNYHGGYVSHVDSYSLGAGRALLGFISCSMDTHLISHTSWDVMAKHTELFLTFGGVPLKNAQVAAGGSGRHRVREGLQAMQRAGTRFVNISPVSDNLETGGEVDWIPIRPNTDTAMMLALAYEIECDDAFDRSFVDRYAVGYDRFRAYVSGETDGTPKTPEWAETITGVPAATIRALAHEMLRKRTMINVAWALQRAAHGEQPFWMVITLAAMLGQIGLPGGGYGLGYGAMNTMGSSHKVLPGPTFSQGRNPVDHFIPVARIADMLLNPGAPFTYQGKTHNYQDIRLIYWAGGNPFHHHQDLNRFRKAWERPETIIVNEQYWAPIARHADIVFPATISLERNDIGFAKSEGFLVAMEKAVDPIGEARDDYEIFADLAERLGFADKFTEGLSADEWVRRIYDDNLARATAVGVELPDFEAFWDKGLIDLAAFDGPVIMHEKFRVDPEANPLKTSTGKLEIFSETIAGFGLEDCPGYPVWIEPFEWLGSGAASDYPLHMISDQPARRLHSQLDHSSFSREAKVAGREPVVINPADAASRSINDGDLVELFNDRGRCLAGAKVSPVVMPGVVRLSTGSWFDPEGGVDRNANPNSLTLDRGASSFSQGCSAQTCLIEVRKFEKGEGFESKAYELPALE